MRMLQRLFSRDRYEHAEMLEYYLKAHYGPYTAKLPTSEFESFYAELNARAIPYLTPETSALDVGCATGRLVFEYAKAGAARVVGTDTSASFIEACKRIQSGMMPQISYPIQYPSRVEFLVDDIGATKLPPHSFTFISCINVLDRVVDPRALIATLHDLLTPGGTLLIADPYDWELSPAPKKLQVADCRMLLCPDAWQILEEGQILFKIPTSATEHREYDCHVVSARKR